MSQPRRQQRSHLVAVAGVAAVVSAALILLAVIALTAGVLVTGHRVVVHASGDTWFLLSDLHWPRWVTWGLLALAAPLAAWPLIFAATATATGVLARIHAPHASPPACSGILRHGLRSWRAQVALALVAAVFLLAYASADWMRPPHANLLLLIVALAAPWPLAVVATGCCRLAEQPTLPARRAWLEAVRHTQHVRGSLRMAVVCWPLIAVPSLAATLPSTLLRALAVLLLAVPFALVLGMTWTARGRVRRVGVPFAKATPGGGEAAVPHHGIDLPEPKEPLSLRQRRGLDWACGAVVALALVGSASLWQWKDARMTQGEQALAEAYPRQGAMSLDEIERLMRPVQRLIGYSYELHEPRAYREAARDVIAAMHPRYRLVRDGGQALGRSNELRLNEFVPRFLREVVRDARRATEGLAEDAARRQRLLEYDTVLELFEQRAERFEAEWIRASLHDQHWPSRLHGKYPRSLWVESSVALDALAPLSPARISDLLGSATPLEDYFAIRGAHYAIPYTFPVTYHRLRQERGWYTFAKMCRLALRVEAHVARTGSLPASLAELDLHLCPDATDTPPSITDPWDPQGAPYALRPGARGGYDLASASSYVRSLFMLPRRPE